MTTFNLLFMSRNFEKKIKVKANSLSCAIVCGFDRLKLYPPQLCEGYVRDQMVIVLPQFEYLRIVNNKKNVSADILFLPYEEVKK